MTKRLITLFTGAAFALALALSVAAEMTQPSEPVTDMMIGSMLMFSFDGTELTADDPFLDLVRKGHVGGVTLFNRKPDGSDMNVASPAQLKRLTRMLTEAAPGPFLIAVDQEGGRVRRLWPGKGFFDLPSAREMSLGSPAQTRETAEKLGRELRKLGIHVDFAPVVDVNVNPDCPIIGALGRSFGTDERTVSAHAQAFGAGLTAQGVIPALKHDYGEWVVTIPATETEAGEETRTCKHDPSHIETRPIPPTGHVETFVERAYRVILNRSGDPEGIAHWDALLASGTSAGEIIAEFFRSDEFRARSLTSEQTVTLCYEAMMDRLPEPEGLANWVAVLDDGYSTTKLVAEFVESDEFQELCDAFGLTAGTIELPARDENSNITRFVMRCYEFALRREADEGGLNEFCEKLLNKTATPEEVAFMFVFSDEAHALWNGNSTFMTMLYRLMLDREPDLGGLENWVAALSAAEDASSKDEGRQQVFQLFAESDEFALMISNFVF